MTDDISIHVFRGYKLMDIYDKTTGFPRLDNMLNKGYNDIKLIREREVLLGADTDGDVILPGEVKFPEVDDETRFRFITEEMVTLYSKKNADYGDAFTQSLDEDGLLVSKIRLKDKLNRFAKLIENDALVNDESMRDTLIDMANYAVMTMMWLDENE